jgi:hypothetical protein
MKTTPHNTGKVKIGEAVYLNKLVNIPYVEQDRDMLELQSYLIHDPHRINREYWLNKVYVGVVLFVTTVILLSN